MVIHKRKKVTKYRAKTTHGGGHRKKRRGAGSRGGRGRAGTGKRASHKKEKLGGKGFSSLKKKIDSINLSFFTGERLDRFVAAEKVVKEGDFYVVDLSKLGYGKLLGSGKINVKLKFKGNRSVKAEEKVKAAGGEFAEA